MNKQNFNPKNYYKLNNSRNKIAKYIKNIAKIDIQKILDIGCGNGEFTKILSKTFSKSFIQGIDIVDSYIDYASNNKNTNIDFKTISFFYNDSKYDLICTFLSMTELLKSKSLITIINKANDSLSNNGYFVVCEEFKDDYDEDRDILGIKIFEELGYKYLDTKEFEENILKYFDIIETRIFETNSTITNISGTKMQIYYENKLNENDNTKTKTSDYIWNKFKDEIIKNNGCRNYNKIRVYILKKKDDVFNKLYNLKITKSTLVYRIPAIKDNIHYYCDLNIDNLKYIFPIKTLPNNKILRLFYDYNFGFDVSNNNEFNLVSDYDTLFLYSDPTNSLQNRSYMRLKIKNRNIKSHFGNEYDNKSYEIFHIHISDKKTKSVLNSIIKTIEKLDFSKTKYLDLGGGYENLSYLELNRYLNKIRKKVPPKVTICLECGSLWFKHSGYLITNIKYIKEARGYSYVFIDASRDLHCKWSNPKPILDNNNETNHNYIICGCSCYEKDLFAIVKTSNLNIGEKMIFKDIEPYSYGLNTIFNGIDKAEVIFYEE